MSDTKCVCGHPLNMHYAVSGRCMKVITRHYSGNVECDCRQYRAEDLAASTPEQDPR